MEMHDDWNNGAIMEKIIKRDEDFPIMVWSSEDDSAIKSSNHTKLFNKTGSGTKAAVDSHGSRQKITQNDSKSHLLVSMGGDHTEFDLVGKKEFPENKQGKDAKGNDDQDARDAIKDWFENVRKISSLSK